MPKKKWGDGTMTVSEAGRKGGLRVRELYGREFLQNIGEEGVKIRKALIEEGKRAIAARAAENQE